jgi:hypothetical protein
MAIDSAYGSALRKKHYAQQEALNKYKQVSAGEFRSPATMSMLGIRQNPGKFIPNEKAQEFLKDFFVTTGLRMNVLPAEGKGDQAGTGFGFYRPHDPKGGSLDPRQRNVYLDNKNADFQTLIHEGGHAQDPTLYEAALDEQMGRDEFFGTAVEGEAPGDNLRRFMSMAGPLGRMKAEATANKYVVDYLKGKGYTDEQIRSMESRAGDYGVYPYSYVQQGFEYREGINPDEAKVTMPDANTVDRAKADFLLNRLGELYTTPGYIQQRDAVADEALAYLKGIFGDFTSAGDKTAQDIYTRTFRS